jgi:Transposase DDE domain
MPARYFVRILFAGQMYTGAGQDGGVQDSLDRKHVEMLFAHLKRILRLGRLQLRGPCGAQFEFTLAAIAQNLRRLTRLVARPPPFAPLCDA